MEAKFKNPDRVLVRKNSAVYVVVGINTLRSRPGMRRYNLISEEPSYGSVRESMEAYESDMTPAPPLAVPQELSLAADPHASGGLAMLLSDGPVASDGVRGHGIPADFTHDAGTFGGEPDVYSPGAQEPGSDAISGAASVSPDGPDVSDGPDAEGFPGGDMRFGSALRKPWLRGYAMSLNTGPGNVRYLGRFEKIEGHPLVSLEDGTPIETFVTEELNGFVVWVKMIDDGGESFPTHCEKFYPRNPTARDAAIEHAVGLARGLVPLFDDQMELLLLQL